MALWLRGSWRALRTRTFNSAFVQHPPSTLAADPPHVENPLLTYLPTITQTSHQSWQPARRWAHDQHAQHAQHAQQHPPCSCWRCGMQSTCPKTEDDKFCGSCGAIQPVTTTDYFAVMGIKPSFDVDVTELERTYKAMQRRLHPDKFSTANPKERAHSEDQAALVNQAYSTLRTPLARARYLLERQGMAPQEGLTVDDPAFLMEVMEAHQAAEDEMDRNVLRTMLDDNAHTQHAIEQQLAAAFEQGKWAEAQQLVWRLTYVVRVAEAIVDKL